MSADEGLKFTPLSEMDKTHVLIDRELLDELLDGYYVDCDTLALYDWEWKSICDVKAKVERILAQ